MRVLVDTCVWSLALRRRPKAPLSAAEHGMASRLAAAIQDGRVVILGPIRQEILSGLRDEAQFKKVSKLLEPFPDDEILTSDYVEAARLFNVCRRQGVQCGPIDILICAVAVRQRWFVMTTDRGLLRCLEVLRKNRLYPADS